MTSKRISFLFSAFFSVALLASACGGSDAAEVASTDASAAPAAQTDTDTDTGDTEAEPEPEPAADTEPEPAATEPEPAVASGSDQEVIDAIVLAMATEADFPPDTDVDCIATAMVNGFGGADVMQAEFGLNPTTIADGQDINDVELPKEQALAIASGMFDCGLMDLMVGEMTGDGLGEAEARCLTENIDQSILSAIVASDLMSEADALEVAAEAEAQIMPSLFAAMTNCDIDPTALGG